MAAANLFQMLYSSLLQMILYLDSAMAEEIPSPFPLLPCINKYLYGYFYINTLSETQYCVANTFVTELNPCHYK